MQFRDLKAQYQALKPKIDEAIQNILNESNFIMGPQVQELEEKPSSICRRKTLHYLC